MKIFKIVLAVFFGIALLGNISMAIKGELNDGWGLFGFFMVLLIFLLLIRSLKLETKK